MSREFPIISIDNTSFEKPSQTPIISTFHPQILAKKEKPQTYAAYTYR